MQLEESLLSLLYLSINTCAHYMRQADPYGSRNGGRVDLFHSKSKLNTGQVYHPLQLTRLQPSPCRSIERERLWWLSCSQKLRQFFRVRLTMFQLAAPAAVGRPTR